MCRHVQSVHGRLVTLVLSLSATEVFLRVAVATGLDETLDLAEYFARSHPRDRLRLASYEARDLLLGDAGRCDALWREAESSGNRILEAVARHKRAALEVS